MMWAAVRCATRCHAERGRSRGSAWRVIDTLSRAGQVRALSCALPRGAFALERTHPGSFDQ